MTGPNVGANAGLTVQFSGTVGAAVYAAHTAGIPAIAFSGASGSPTAWNASTPLSSQVYADLALNVTSTIIASGTPYLPNDAWLNVNFGAMTSTTCTSASKEDSTTRCLLIMLYELQPMWDLISTWQQLAQAYLEAPVLNNYI